ncbi:MAG: MFS transporter [Dehalococcoidia bacterium]
MDSRDRSPTLFRPGRPVHPRTLFLLLSALTGLFNSITFTLYGVYVVTGAGFDPLQLVLAGTAVEFAVFVSEVPTGVVADAYSRRASVIVGYVISGIGFALMGASPTFLFIAGGQAVWGVGWTFISGAREAWLTDEIGVRESAPVFVRSVQVAQIARLLGIPLAVLIASSSLQAPLIVGGAGSIGLALMLMFTMTEAGYSPAAGGERNTWASMVRALRLGVSTVRSNSAMITILLIGVLYGASSEAIDRLDSLQMIETIGLPGGMSEVQWFGVFGAVSLIGGAIATGLAGRLSAVGEVASTRPLVRTLTALTVVLTIASFAFALTDSIWVALVALWITAWVRVAIRPLTLIWLNRGLASRSRATVLSMLGQSDALGQVAGGPVLGLVGTLRTVRAALVGVGLILLPALGLYGRELVRGDGAAAEEGD